jgi:acetyl esterase
LRDPTATFLTDMTAALAVLDDAGLSLDDLRRRGEELTAPVWAAYAEAGPEVADVSDVVVPTGPGGDLRARIYRPLATDGALPSRHLFLHGGGWWQGSIDSWIVDAQARERCAGAGAVVVSLDYRKAPEHPFPAAVEDCYATLAWIGEGPPELGPSLPRLTVSGVSAGANLAAAAVLVARERGGPLIDQQILEAVPADLRVEEPTAWSGPDGTGIDRAEFAAIVDRYLRVPADAANPWASPLVEADLSGLPRTTILIGDRDPLRAGCVAFAGRLASHGVDVSLQEFPGFVHHTPALTRTVPAARAWRSVVLDAIAGRDPS